MGVVWEKMRIFLPIKVRKAYLPYGQEGPRYYTALTAFMYTCEAFMTISALYSASSALQAFPQGMESVAYNLSNVQGEGYARTEFVELSTTGVDAHAEIILPPTPTGYADYATDIVNMIVYENAHAANATTVQTVDDMLGVVVNMKV